MAPGGAAKTVEAIVWQQLAHPRFRGFPFFCVPSETRQKETAEQQRIRQKLVVTLQEALPKDLGET
jgi:hypothetical protein